jgi:hypothetical protein
MKWRIFGGIALAVAAIGVALNMKSLKRYVRMSTM